MDNKDKSDMDTEFQKLCKLNYCIPIESLPEALQSEIWASDVINFLSVDPAYKSSSISTKCPAAVNGGRKHRHSNLSMCDLSLTGQASLDLAATFRQFKSRPGAEVREITNF